MTSNWSLKKRERKCWDTPRSRVPEMNWGVFRATSGSKTTNKEMNKKTLGLSCEKYEVCNVQNFKYSVLLAENAFFSGRRNFRRSENRNATFPLAECFPSLCARLLPPGRWHYTPLGTSTKLNVANSSSGLVTLAVMKLKFNFPNVPKVVRNSRRHFHYSSTLRQAR